MKPLVAVTACYDDEAYPLAMHRVGDKYLRALASGCDVIPVLLPAFGDEIDAHALALLIDRFDGFLFTGSRSNVLPQHYGAENHPADLRHDPRRDATTLPLLRLLIERDRPLLAICRGMQELNVACGGTLHQQVHEVSGMLDHRAPSRDLPIGVRYAPEHHTVRLTPQGALAALADQTDVMVNSLHQQGIDRLGANLAIEATAPDGLIEAIRVATCRFALGGQWHPEACMDSHRLSREIFGAFGDAVRGRS